MGGAGRVFIFRKVRTEDAIRDLVSIDTTGRSMVYTDIIGYKRGIRYLFVSWGFVTFDSSVFGRGLWDPNLPVLYYGGNYDYKRFDITRLNELTKETKDTRSGTRLVS